MAGESDQGVMSASTDTAPTTPEERLRRALCAAEQAKCAVVAHIATVTLNVLTAWIDREQARGRD